MLVAREGTETISRRAVLRSLVVGGTVGLLAACGQSAASPPPAPAGATSPPAGASAPTAAPQQATQATQGSQTLTWLVRSQPQENPWEKDVVIPAFKKLEPNVTINMVLTPDNQWSSKVLAMYAGGTAPDVHNGIVGTFIQLYAQGKVRELTPYIATDKIDLTPFGGLAKDPDMCRNGKQWCLPILTTLGMPIVYNIDLFDKAGVPHPPTDPKDRSWNLDKIVEISQKLTKSWGTADASYGFVSDNQFHEWAYLWKADPWLKEWYEHGIAQKSNYTDPKVAEALQFRADLINKYKVMPRPADQQALSQVGDIFKTGRVAMSWNVGVGYWNYTDITAFKWGVAPGPWRDSNKAVNFTDPVLVSGESKIPEIAWALVKYLTSKEGQTDYVKATGTPSPRQDVLTDVWLDFELAKTGMTSKDDLRQVALYWTDDYIDNWAHYTINAGQLQTIQSQDGNSIWQGQATAASQAAKIQQDIDDALAKTYDQYKSTRLVSDTLCQPIHD